MNLGGVFNEENPLVRRNELSEHVEQGSLTAPGGTGDENIFSSENVFFESIGKPAFERSGLNEVARRRNAGR